MGGVSLEKIRPRPYFDAAMTDYEARFGGIRRLYGTDGETRLRHARVCVIGVGGVGSWAVEALARTGVGALALVVLVPVGYASNLLVMGWLTTLVLMAVGMWDMRAETR